MSELECIRRDSSVGIETGCRLDGWGSVPGRSKNSFIVHSNQTGFGAQPAFYPVIIGGKAAGT
jgi:hypothetical protein